MVSVLPRASPRAAAFGRKSNLAMAASTACLRPLLTLTVPLMIRDTVLAETPASRATIRSVADWRGRGPLLPGVGAGNLDFIRSPARRPRHSSRGGGAAPEGGGFLFPRSRAQRLLRLCENPFQFLERLSLGLGRQHQDEQEAGGGQQSVAEKSSRGTPSGKLRREEQRDAGAHQGVPKSDHRNCRGALVVWKDLGQH